MKLPKYVQAWVDAEGRPHCYFRRRGFPRVPLKGLLWSPSFMAEYEKAMSGARTAIGAGRVKAGSVAAVIAEYKDSREFFGSKSAGTQRMRRGILDRFGAAYGDRPFALLPSEWIEALLEAHHPVGTKPRLALALLLYTAQRRSDVVRIGRQHIRNGALTVKQQKTGTELPPIPVLPELQAVLDATPSEHLTFLVTATGKPYGGNAF